MITLGDKVKDPVTGYRGIAVCRVTYLQGCYRIGVQSPVNKEGKKPDWEYFDEPQLKVIKKKVVKQGRKVTGGWKPDAAERR